MSEVKPGGVEIKVNVKDLTQEGINSAKQSLQNLEKTARGTTDNIAPLKDVLSGKLDNIAALSSIANFQGGINGLFESATRAGDVLKKTSGALGKLNEAGGKAGGLLNTLKVVGDLTAAISGQYSLLQKIGNSYSNFDNFLNGIKSGKDIYTAQAKADVENSAAMLKNKDRLIELVKTRQKSAEQIKESVNLVNQMNSTYKGLNLTVDATNGKIGNIKNLKNRIDAEHALNIAESERLLKKIN